VDDFEVLVRREHFVRRQRLDQELSLLRPLLQAVSGVDTQADADALKERRERNYTFKKKKRRMIEKKKNDIQAKTNLAVH
jgi:hypothetical protein